MAMRAFYVRSNTAHNAISSASGSGVMVAAPARTGAVMPAVIAAAVKHRALRRVGVVGFFPVSRMEHPRAWDQARAGIATPRSCRPCPRQWVFDAGTQIICYTASMARPRTMAGRKIVSLPPNLEKAVDDFRFENRFPTESEAVRRLIELGLEAAKAAESQQ